MSTKAYGARAADQPVTALEIERRAPGPGDVQIEIKYCGVCHSDLHTVRSEWPGTLYPCVPGHEIVGHVSAVGADVRGFKVGDTVGVGCLVDSCRHCASCDEGLEQYCTNGFVGTYNDKTADAPGHTLGGYAQRIVVEQRFVLKIRHPEDQLAAVAPLLCAGITTYSPLRHWKAGPGKKVGIVGIGGLGHMGIKIALDGRARGAFTTSESKRAEAHTLGADEVVNCARKPRCRPCGSSTSSSTPWPRRMTWTRSPVCQARRHHVPGRRAGIPHTPPSVMGLIFGRKPSPDRDRRIPETRMLAFCASTASSPTSR